MIILVTTSASRPKTIGGILGLNRFHVLWKAFGTVPAFIENSMQTVRHRLTSATLYFVRLFITNVIHFDVRFAGLFVIWSRSVRGEIILSWHEQVRQFRYRHFVTVKGRVRLVCNYQSTTERQWHRSPKWSCSPPCGTLWSTASLRLSVSPVLNELSYYG